MGEKKKTPRTFGPDASGEATVGARVTSLDGVAAGSDAPTDGVTTDDAPGDAGSDSGACVAGGEATAEGAAEHVGGLRGDGRGDDSQQAGEEDQGGRAETHQGWRVSRAARRR